MSLATAVVPAFRPDAVRLERALESLRLQTVTDFSVLVIDDGSPQPVRLPPSIQDDPRFRLVRLPVNVGRGAVRAFALEKVTSKYLLWQDADDFSVPKRLELLLQHADSTPPAPLIGSTGYFLDPGTGSVIGIGPRAARALCTELSHVLHPGLLLNVQYAKEIGYDPRFRSSEDRDFLRRALTDGPARIALEPLYCYEVPAAARKFFRSAGNRARMGFQAGGREALDAALAASRAVARGIVQLHPALGRAAWNRRLRPPTAGEVDVFVRTTASLPRPGGG